MEKKIFGDSHDKSVMEILDVVAKHIISQQYNDAYALLSNAIATVEKNVPQKDADGTIYHHFTEPMELILFTAKEKPEKEIRDAEAPYELLYYTYGYLLIEQYKHREALPYLRKAIEWNPSSFQIRMEYTEAYKAMGDLEEFMRQTKDAARFAFKVSHIARIYRNFTFYFVEKKNWEAAAAVASVSRYFSKNPLDLNLISNEIRYIRHHGKVKTPKIKSDDIAEAMKKYQVPVLPDLDTLDLIYASMIGTRDTDEYNDEEKEMLIGYYSDILDEIYSLVKK